MLYPLLIRPLLFQCDPEWIHDALHHYGKRLQENAILLQLFRSLFSPHDLPALRQSMFDETFVHPIGLAAGFDKQAHLLPLWQALGFGFAEVGSFSYQPWAGNPKPRLFRLPRDKAIINRMGLNNPGSKTLIPQLEGFTKPYPVGVSLVPTPDPKLSGQAAIDDYVAAYQTVYGLGAYTCFNLSCPNTAEGKTFESPEVLESLLQALFTANQAYAGTDSTPRPWVLKISPDLSNQQLAELFEVACRFGIQGWVATNSTTLRSDLKTPHSQLTQIGRGGLSGKPLLSGATQTLGNLYQLCQKYPQPITLIGVGGILTVEDAWQKICHGASLLQVYTGLIYHGPGFIRTLCHGLSRKLTTNGLTHIQQAVGLAYR